MKPGKIMKAFVMLATCLTLAGSSILMTACQNEGGEEQLGPQPHKHTWDEGTVTTAATCTEDGVLTQHCTVEGCTQTNLKKIYAAHKWGEPVTVDPSCTQGGSKTIECSACHEKEVETYFRIPHDITGGVCSICGQGPAVSLGEDEISFVTDAENGFADLKAITESFEFPGTVYKVYANAEKDMRLNNDEDTTIGDRHFSRSVYFNGKGNLEGEYAVSRVLEATYAHSGGVTVYLRMNSATQMNVWVKDGDTYKVVEEYPIVEGDKEAHVWEFDVNAGTYYFGTTQGSARIYGIDFAEKEIEVHVHDFRFSSYKTEPTCYAGGVAIYACSDDTCEETQERSVPRAHKYDEGSEVCSVCHIDTVTVSDLTDIPTTNKGGKNLTTDYTLGTGITLLSSAAKQNTGRAVNASVGDKNYTKAIELGGRLNSPDIITGDNTVVDEAYARAVKVEMPSAGGIEVVANNNGGSATTLLIATSTEIIARYELSSAASVWTVPVDEAGDYYIGTTTGSALIFSVTAEYIAPAHVHLYDKLKSTTVAATCHSDGEAVYECSCGETETRTVKGGHKLTGNVCSVCGNTVVSADIASQEVKDSIKVNVDLGTIFTAVATTDKAIAIANESATVDGVTYGKAVSLGGKVNATATELEAGNCSRGIKVSMPAAGKITIIIKPAKKNADAKLIYLLNGVSTTISEDFAANVSVKTYTFDVTEAGDYYIGTSTGGGLVYAVTAEYIAPAVDGD